MDKRFLSILGGIIAIFIVIFAISQHSSNNSGASSSTQPTNHVEGQGSSGVKLVEYGDYQCPVCGSYYQPLKDIFSQFSGQIYFQFRNLPLTSLHPNAFAGARAAEAAGLQGKYWQMHDMLYDQNVSYYNSNETTDTWINASNPLSDFVSFAQQLGLNTTKFKTDYQSEQVNNYIQADLNAFAKTNQEQATPTFFLDGTYVPYSKVTDTNGAPDVQKFVSLLNAEIAKKKNT